MKEEFCNAICNALSKGRGNIGMYSFMEKQIVASHLSFPQLKSSTRPFVTRQLFLLHGLARKVQKSFF